MLYITAFSNYEEFQELFGVRQFDNGNKSRKNKILLALLKDKAFFKEAIKSGDLYPFSIKNMVNLRNYLTHRITVSGAKSKKLRHKIWLLDRYYYSEIYDMLTNDPSLSFGDIEARFIDFYGKGKINRTELESSYELAREDILFWNDEKENKSTKVLI